MTDVIPTPIIDVIWAPAEPASADVPRACEQLVAAYRLTAPIPPVCTSVDFLELVGAIAMVLSTETITSAQARDAAIRAWNQRAKQSPVLTSARPA